MTYDARSIAKQCLSLAGGAFVTFAVTLILLIALGTGLAIVSWLALSDSPWGYRAAAAVLALVEGVAAGIFLGTKRAASGAIVRGLGSLHLGRMVVGVVFDKMLRLNPSDDASASDAKSLDRAQAERRLNAVVREVEQEGAGQGALQRMIGRRLLAAVQHYLLGRFASEKSLIDFGRIRTESERAIDERLIDRFRSGARLTTLLVVVALPLAAALQIWLIGRIT